MSNRLTIIASMAKAIFLHHLITTDGSEHSHVPIIHLSSEFIDQAPETPESAFRAAYDFIDKLEQCNNASLMTIFDAAQRADGGRPDMLTEQYLIDFGYHVAMESLGHSMSWSIKHNEFDINGNPFVVPSFHCFIQDY